jgi:hypothetical protein
VGLDDPAKGEKIMSRLYGMDLNISGCNITHKEAIMGAVKEEWTFDKQWSRDDSISMYGEDYLCGGMSDEEFAGDLCKTIWKANRGFCHVNVNATYLEDLPSEDFTFEEEEYKEMMEENNV